MDLSDVPEETAADLRELHDTAYEVIETAMDALLADDSEEAARLGNEARETVEEFDAIVREVDEHIRELDPQQAQVLGLVVDSLSRSADYGGNIAETALQKAAPKP